MSHIMKIKLVSCFAIFAALFAVLGEGVPTDPVFDFNFIANEPLQSKLLKLSEHDGIIVEEIEFMSDYDPAGKPIRTFGILAYPKGGKNLPGIVWAMGGMADAEVSFPEIFARKGYMAISVNLPLKEWNGWGAFNAADPKNSNFVRLAVTHMRAVTYLANRPEINKERLGVGGASYGGMFANMVAGADPRIKAGMSFFSGGNHHLGTNLPQFLALSSLADIEVFKTTADGGFRFRGKSVPFLWGVASNDHWFELPAVVQTYIEAGGADKRIAIKPQWAHGFPPEFDQELIDWFDVHLKKIRDPYNQPSAITVKFEQNKLMASWGWQGKNKIVKAELIVSYGRVLPWHGWIHRYNHRIKAEIDNVKASAEIPVFEPSMPIYMYANIMDSNGVLTSSEPVTLIPEKAGCVKKTATRPINAAPWGDFEPEDFDFLSRHTELPFGVADAKEKASGTQSLCVESPGLAGKGHILDFKLFNVYERSHKLSLMVKSNKPAKLKIEVKVVPPANWQSPALKAILASMGEPPAPAAGKSLPTHLLEAATNDKWQKFTLECPFSDVPAEGYYLSLDFPSEKDLTIWLDAVEFIPVWK